MQSDLQVPLDLADVVLQQEVVLQGEAAVLVVQLSQEVMEPNCCQRFLHRHRFPEEGHSNIFNREETEKKVKCLVLSEQKSNTQMYNIFNDIKH